MTHVKNASTGIIEHELTVGLSAMEGRGFYYPSDTAIGKDGRFYVVNRSLETVVRGVRVTMCDIDSEYYGVFGAHGEDDGQFIWASCAAIDSEGRVYVTDEYLSRVSVFDPDGRFLRKWGESGAVNGELDGPSGIAIDGEDTVYVSDTHNGRVQRFTADGRHLLTFGSGELKLPWGLTVAPSGDVYVADWGNDRIARFSPSGELVGSYGRAGRGDGELLRPASVAVDGDGYIYVADWGNERVQVLDPGGAFVMKTRGEATLSKWAENFLRINNEEADARSRADLEPEIDLFDPDDPHEESSQIEKLFWAPISVKLDSSGQLLVTESNRHRIQIFRKAD